MANAKLLQQHTLRLTLNPQENTLVTKIAEWENLQNTNINTIPLVAWLAEQNLMYTNVEVVRITKCKDDYKLFHGVKCTVVGPGLPYPVSTITHHLRRESTNIYTKMQ
jgi:hypothetical protein